MPEFKQNNNMLDYFSKKILLKISELCPDSNYKIVEIGDFSDCFDGQVIIEEGLDKALKKLSVLGYTSLRYDRDGEYCLGITDKGRSLVLNEKLEKLSNKKKNIFMTCFLQYLMFFVINFCLTMLALFVFHILLNA